MSRTRTLTCLAAALLVASAAMPLGAEETTSKWKLNLTLGGQYTDLSGDRTSKFEEYRDMSNGAVIDDGSLVLVDPASPWSFALTGDKLLRDDAEAGLKWSKAGRFHLSASWNRTPHFLSRGATSLWTRNGGSLEIADGLQSSIESFFTGSTAPTTDQARAFMNGILAQAAHSIDLQVQRDTARVDLAFDLTPSWSLAIAGLEEKKSGVSRIGTGTYIRRQTAGSFDRNRFEPRSNELPLPIDYKTNDYGIGTGFRQKGWFFDVDWKQSSFENRTGTLTWDNPFEGFPGATSSLTGLDPNFEQEPSGPTANTNNRGRFATAQLDLFPDNDYERLHATGAVDLPGRTRVNASYSTAKMKQDDSFLAYTINPAVIYSNGPDGVGGTADDVLAQNVALPRASLGGEIQTTNMDLRVTSRPIDPLSLRGSYRTYEYDDKSPSIVFPGFAAAGDSYFRPGIGQRINGVRVLFNEPGGYTRTAWTVGGAWSFGHPATLDVEYTDTTWDYDERQVKSTSEGQLSAKLRLAFGERLEARITYLDASRDAEGAYNIGFETSRLRAFDVWNRDRTRYGAELAWLIGDNSSLSFNYQNWQDDYPGVLPEPVPASTSNPYPSLAYGLNKTENQNLSATWSYGVERWSLSASAGLENTKWSSMATAKTTLTGDSPQFDPANRWVRVQDDDVLWAALSFETKVGGRGKLFGDIDYHDYSGDYRTTNLGTPTVNDGVAYAMPGFSSSLFSGTLSFECTLNAKFDLGARYLYEPYRLDDWQWDLVQPYMQGVLQETGGSPTTIRDATANRGLFLDSTYSDYTANVFTVYLKIHI